ncbi:MAG: aminopeptidase, partial [Planctomycetota bacterium]
IDLDWFWRGWFYSNHHVDLAITDVRQLNINTQNPKIEKGILKKQRDSIPESFSEERNKGIEKRTKRYPELKDFYNKFDELDVTPADRENYQRFLSGLDDDQKKILNSKWNFYLIDFKNIGGLVMPIIFDAHFKDGTTEQVRIPAEIWRRNNQQVTKLFMTEKDVVSITLDPRLETADVDLSNNHFPPKISKSRFEVFKSSRRGATNPMQSALQWSEKAKESKSKKKGRNKKADAKRGGKK